MHDDVLEVLADYLRSHGYDVITDPSQLRLWVNPPRAARIIIYLRLDVNGNITVAWKRNAAVEGLHHLITPIVHETLYPYRLDFLDRLMTMLSELSQK